MITIEQSNNQFDSQLANEIHSMLARAMTDDFVSTIGALTKDVTSSASNRAGKSPSAQYRSSRFRHT